MTAQEIEVLPLLSLLGTGFRPHSQLGVEGMRVGAKMRMSSGAHQSCCRSGGCPTGFRATWIRATTAPADHLQVHPQFGGKQCKPPGPAFCRPEAGLAALSAKQQHCDIPRDSPNEGMTLGSPKPFLPHWETEKGTNSSPVPGREFTSLCR